MWSTEETLDEVNNKERLYFFSMYILVRLSICVPLPPSGPAHLTVPFQVATHLGTDRVLLWTGQEPVVPGLLHDSQVRYF